MIKVQFKGEFFEFPRLVQHKYLVQTLIGKGSNGAVYNCVDLLLKKQCVIKIVTHTADSNLFVSWSRDMEFRTLSQPSLRSKYSKDYEIMAQSSLWLMERVKTGLSTSFCRSMGQPLSNCSKSLSLYGFL